jgi:hypothetical protein
VLSPPEVAELLRVLRGGRKKARAALSFECDLPSKKWTPQQARNAPGCPSNRRRVSSSALFSFRPF